MNAIAALPSTAPVGGTRNVRPPRSAPAGKHAHRAGLPEQHAVRRRLGRGGPGDRAAVAAQHQVDAGVVQLIDGRGGGVGAGRVHRFDADRPAVDAAVLVDEVGGEHDAAVLVDAARPLRSRERDTRRPTRMSFDASSRVQRHAHEARCSTRATASFLIEGSPPRRSRRHGCAAGTVQVPDGPPLPGEQQSGPQVDRERGDAVERQVHGREQQRRAEDRDRGTVTLEPPVRGAAEQRLLGDGGEDGERERPDVPSGAETGRPARGPPRRRPRVRRP